MERSPHPLMSRRQDRGFTLVELIVTIVILGILASIAVVGYQSIISNTKLNADKATLSSVGREAQALAAFDNDGVVTADHVLAALADLPPLSSAGVYASQVEPESETVNGWTVVSGDDAVSEEYGTIAIDDDPTGAAVLAMQSRAGGKAVVTRINPTSVTTCDLSTDAVTVDDAYNCGPALSLAGPGPATTTTTVPVTTTTVAPSISWVSNPPTVWAPTTDMGLTPAVSGDGQVFAFESLSQLVPEDTNGDFDIYLYDRSDDSITLVSVARDGTAAGASREPSISNGGRPLGKLGS